MIFDPARDNRLEVIEVGIHIEADAMETDPAANADSYKGDFLFAPVITRNPYANAVWLPLRFDAERGERCDDPFLQIFHERAQPLSTRLQIEHRIDDPLPRSVIGRKPSPRASV